MAKQSRLFHIYVYFSCSSFEWAQVKENVYLALKIVFCLDDTYSALLVLPLKNRSKIGSVYNNFRVKDTFPRDMRSHQESV